MILQKMPLQTTNLKYISSLLGLFCLCFTTIGHAQEILPDEEEEAAPLLKKKDDPGNKSRIKADGVAAVVGDYIVLESDLDREIAQLEAQGADLRGRRGANYLEVYLKRNYMPTRLYRIVFWLMNFIFNH